MRPRLKGWWIPIPLRIVDIRWVGKTTINILSQRTFSLFSGGVGHQLTNSHTPVICFTKLQNIFHSHKPLSNFLFTSEFVTVLLPTLSRFYYRVWYFCSPCRIRTYDDLHVRQGLYHWAKELLSCVFGVRTRLTFLMRESSFPLSHAIYVVRGGFEPPLHVPKTCVLPLDDPTI